MSLDVVLLCCLLLSLLLGPIPITLMGRAPSLYFGDAMVILAAVYAFAARRPLHMSNRAIRPVVIWLGLYCLAVLATLPKAVDILRCLAYAKLYVMPFLVFTTAIRLFRSRFDLNRVLLTCSVVGVGLSLGALYNWTLYQSGALRLQQGLGAKDMIQIAGLRSNSVAGTAALLLPGALFALWQKQMRWRAIGIAALCGLCATILFSMSRGAIVASVLGVGVPLTWQVLHRTGGQALKAMRALIALAALGCLSWLLFPTGLQTTFIAQIERARFEVISAPEKNDRLNRWGALAQEGLKTPLGIGVGNYEYVSSLKAAEMGGSAHNLYLEVLNEAGWLGFVALLLCLRYVWRNIKNLQVPAKTTNAAAHSWIALTMMFWTFAINVAIEPNYFSPQFTLLFWLVMGTATAAVANLQHSRVKAARFAAV